jgi:CheY-like chemotaxis protein
MEKVLLIDDDKTANFLTKIVLKRSGINQVEEALNGLEGFSRIEKECPDLILLDINMPVMDGWTFLEEKKSKAPCRNVKIAMLTSSARANDQEKAEQYSCVIGYYQKPLTKEKIEMIRQKAAS